MSTPEDQSAPTEAMITLPLSVVQELLARMGELEKKVDQLPDQIAARLGITAAGSLAPGIDSEHWDFTFAEPTAEPDCTTEIMAAIENDVRDKAPADQAKMYFAEKLRPFAERILVDFSDHLPTDEYAFASPPTPPPSYTNPKAWQEYIDKNGRSLTWKKTVLYGASDITATYLPAYRTLARFTVHTETEDPNRNQHKSTISLHFDEGQIVCASYALKNSWPRKALSRGVKQSFLELSLEPALLIRAGTSNGPKPKLQIVRYSADEHRFTNHELDGSSDWHTGCGPKRTFQKLLEGLKLLPVDYRPLE